MTAATLGLGLVSFGFGEILLFIGIVILLFGAKRLPMLARGLGAGIRNFKGELNAGRSEDPDDTPGT